MMQQWFEEVTFRGRPPEGPGSDQSSEFHITIGRQGASVLNPGEYERKFLGPLTPAQAEAMGMDVATILADINTAALNDVASLTAQVDQLAQEKADLSASAEAAANGYAATLAAKDAEITDLKADIAALRAALIILQTPAAAAPAEG
jgi:hypothetical protein